MVMTFGIPDIFMKFTASVCVFSVRQIFAFLVLQNILFQYAWFKTYINLVKYYIQWSKLTIILNN